MSEHARNLDTWNDAQDGDRSDVGELLDMIRQLVEVAEWYSCFYNDVEAVAPEYYELCGDLNATVYLHSEADRIRERAVALLEEWLPDAPDVEPDYSDLPL